MAAEIESTSLQRWKKGPNPRTIRSVIETGVPFHSVNSRRWTWKQFEQFCRLRNYNLSEKQNPHELNRYLTDWACNMKKANGEDYKDHTVKTVWNVSSKLLQQYYHEEFGEKINPFKDHEFQGARDSRDIKCEQLHQRQSIKRKLGIQTPIRCKIERKLTWNKKLEEETPGDLVKKLVNVISGNLNWTVSEASRARIDYFHEETDIDDVGRVTERIEYNPTLSKTVQDDYQSVSKWLLMNTENPDLCPVRLFRLFLERRQGNEVEQLFLEPNPNWDKAAGGKWFQDVPLSARELTKWMSECWGIRAVRTNYRPIAPSTGVRLTKMVILSTPMVTSGFRAIAPKCPEMVTGLDNQVIRSSSGNSVSVKKSKPTVADLLECKGNVETVPQVRVKVEPEEEPVTCSDLNVDREVVKEERRILNLRGTRTDNGMTFSGVNGFESMDGIHVTYNNCTFHIDVKAKNAI